MLKIISPYDLPDELPSEVYLGDHLGGFDHHYHNPVLARLDQYCHEQQRKIKIYHHTVITELVQRLYPSLEFAWAFDSVSSMAFNSFLDYRCHPELHYKKFICSFNGSDHVSRKLLVASLQRWHWFDPDTCSKNFTFTTDKLDGHLADYVNADQHHLYRTFFISPQSEEFFDQIYSFGHVRHAHDKNIHNLDHRVTQSFLQIVSESMATSHCPFVTEKFLYSVVTRGLFVAYAQPGWHHHLDKVLGFRRYDRLFDYQFDHITNPVERLLAMLCMISKFSILSPKDWHDLYEIEKDTIEHNYHHYFSGEYLKKLRTHA